MIIRILRSSSIRARAQYSVLSSIFTSRPKLAASHQHLKIRRISLFQTNNSNNLCTKSKIDGAEGDEEDLEKLQVEYILGRPQIVVPLPSREECCRFILKPISDTVADFHKMINDEDQGADRIICTTLDDVRIAGSTSIQNLILEDFKLSINEVEYHVESPHLQDLSSDHINNISFIQKYISHLYESMNVQEYEMLQEKELLKQRELIKLQLFSLETKRRDLDVRAERRARFATWMALVYMSIQCGLLGRLTWWEYSWDIMEPVTYFVSYGTTMAAFGYFLVTRQKYDVVSAKERLEVLSFHDAAKRYNFDASKYNMLKDQMAVVEKGLKSLQDPVRFRAVNIGKTKVGGKSQEATKQVICEQLQKK